MTQNSDFRRDAWGRLRRTADFVGTTTYGTTEAAERAGARVRGIHARLTATDPDTGARYGLDEPALLLWVHCAEIDSYLHVLRRSGFPLTDAQADRYVAEHRADARLVGLDPETVPASRAELAAYFAKVRPELAAGPEAREVDDFLRRPPIHPLLIPARELLWRWVARLAYASLPAYAHELYGRPAPAPATVTRELRATGAVLRAIPARVRWQLPEAHPARHGPPRPRRPPGPGQAPAVTVRRPPGRSERGMRSACGDPSAAAGPDRLVSGAGDGPAVIRPTASGARLWPSWISACYEGPCPRTSRPARMTP